MRRNTSPDNLNFIRKIAWNFHNSTGVEYNELFQEACLAYFVLKSRNTFDPSRASWKTLVYTEIHSWLKCYLKRERKLKERLKFSDTVSSFCTGFSDNRKLLESMTPDALQITEVILKFSQQFVAAEWDDVVDGLCNVFSEQDWTIDRMERGIQEIHMALTENN